MSCLDRTLFNESFHVTHATPSTVCQKITCKSLQHSKKFRHFFVSCCNQGTNMDLINHQVGEGGAFLDGDIWWLYKTARWHDSRCDLRKLWNLRKPFLTRLTCLRFSLSIEVVYIYNYSRNQPRNKLIHLRWVIFDALNYHDIQTLDHNLGGP